MNCYVCATNGVASSAVAVCPHCQAGLCLEHVAETAREHPGGMDLSCSHDTWSADRPVASG